MGFAKVLKTRQYFKRYQTKFRRRRECKTDYYARKRMILRDVNKYGSPKYRLVARFSNTRVICQIVYSTLEGDKVLCEANSSELSKWGLTTGQKSYPAAYATGLLLARRLLKQINLDQMYQGAEEVSGDDYNVASLAETYQNDKRPFKAILDIGLTRSTIGNRVYAVLKGACDGGLNIPHNTKNFYGTEKDEDSGKLVYYPEAHRDRLFGCHIDNHMNHEDLGEHSQFQFSAWKKCLKAAGCDSVEALFTKVFAGIRADPSRQGTKSERKAPQYANDEKTLIKSMKKDKQGNATAFNYPKQRKLTNAQRKQRVQEKIDRAYARLEEMNEED